MLFLTIRCYQNKRAILIWFLQEGDTVILIYTRYVKASFTCQKIKLGNFLIYLFFKQTLRDIILLFHDMARLDMNLEERSRLCRKAWET